MPITNSSTPSFRRTIALFSVALSRTPRTSRIVMKTVIRTARRLKHNGCPAIVGAVRRIRSTTAGSLAASVR